jgi:hypothetical protein
MTAPLSRAAARPKAQLELARRATPARLRFAAVSIAVLALLTGLVGVLATTQRQSATTRAWQGAEPLMVTAQAIDTSLSDADTTAAASFLQGRVAPAALQTRYQADLTRAAADVAQAAREGGTDTAVTASLQTLSTDLPLYAGIIQEADFNERQGFYPLAAAYLAEANNLMRSSILPAAAQVYGTEVNRLAGDQTSAVSPWLVALAALFLIALLVALVIAQQRLRRHFHRTWNVALAAATVIILVVGVWATVALATQNSGVTNAQANGSRPVSAFTDARILALRARADDELTLLTRDSDSSYQADYRSTAAALSRLLDAGSGATGSAGSFDASQTAQAKAAFMSYAALHRQIRTDDITLGDLGQAVALASGTGAHQLPAVSSQLNDVLSRGINGSQATFVNATSGAGSDLNGLTWGFVIAAILTAILVLVGFQPRIAEYR